MTARRFEGDRVRLAALAGLRESFSADLDVLER